MKKIRSIFLSQHGEILKSFFGTLVIILSSSGRVSVFLSSISFNELIHQSLYIQFETFGVCRLDREPSLVTLHTRVLCFPLWVPRTDGQAVWCEFGIL